ncbi:MAG: hypothetical protein GKS00_19560 [Alphaproteobacteria bacterium]|nr:hypothetical protein [Alphaproteobacteria bacterium]
MLNVAVSRARDSFLVFGDMDVFSTAAAGTPRALLARFLFSSPDNALEFEVAPREDLVLHSGQLITLRDAAEHDAFLLNALGKRSAKYMIVSPWVTVPTMKRAGLLDALRAAAKRGAEIDIYVDPAFNQKQTQEGLTYLEAAETAFKEIGVTLRKVRQLHSKIVAVDDTLLCIGSFNWLSASRVGKYVSVRPDRSAVQKK